MADISKIDFGDGVERDIKDATARAIATTQSVGRVKPDGTTITIDENGTISSVGGGGSSTLDGLTDTNISNPSNGQALVYDSLGQEWINQNVSVGNTTSQQRISILFNYWSASQNSSGYYTCSMALTQALNINIAPKVYCTGSSTSTLPTDTQKGYYNLLDYVELTNSITLVLYAKKKPGGQFFILVEGVSA